MHRFLQHFGTHSFQINLRVLHNLKGVFRTIWNIYDEAFSRKYLAAFSRCIFVEMLHHRYLIEFCIRLCILHFIYFSTFFVWILEWTIWNCVVIRKVCSYFPHMTQIRNIIRYFIGSQTICFVLTMEISIFLYSYNVEM